MYFKENLRRFKDTTANYQCDGLIILGSRQAETAALLIGALRPQHVALILTLDTQQFKQEICSFLVNDVDYLDQSIQEFGPATNAYDTQEIYKLLRVIFDRWPTDCTYAVDVTGGTKPMTVGLAKAAYLLELPTIYVASDYNEETNRIVKDTQRFTILPDPYVVFGDIEAEESYRLANRQDYSGAHRIFEKLARREQMPDNLREHFRYLTMLTGTYADWDVFNLNGACQQIEKLIQFLNSTKLPRLDKHKNVLKKQSTFLERLNKTNADINKAPFTILRDDLPTVLALLGSLYANAVRREKQGRYDFAALLLYRCLELMSQRRLASHGVDADKQRIKLYAGYKELQKRQDAFIKNYAITRISETNKSRNKSILAHGFRLIRSNEYNQFKEVVDELMERFFATEGENLEEWKNDFTFIELDKVNL
ncbi:MAG: hypothetical protein GFH27_549285n34 [Chloroflexi bacterium AL-W]|nr:hypothetical protein [Chloroflexi bacterium AL-N1]NOK65546.1 hypothetical protein [Chloroflexi bacterium AL-N10]NOK74512.1 hypothetical protein [Chloroflexi bacterium AL-N5]NOK80579.1 hypothetical protein [Chloroflexi bacterium AL-W]NOK88770.1 hypothetical protein [Chloroflexi bacterium AL-N15]